MDAASLNEGFFPGYGNVSECPSRKRTCWFSVHNCRFTIHKQVADPDSVLVWVIERCFGLYCVGVKDSDIRDHICSQKAAVIH